MALKGDRNVFVSDVSFFMNEAATRGGVVCLSTAGSGASMDDSSALVTYAADPSGKKPIGLLLNDMVNIDQTRQKINPYKDEVQKGGKVNLLMDGFVVTNYITPNDTPSAGQTAYIGPSGYIGTGVHSTSDANDEVAVGRFLSTKDSDGYAKVYVKLPVTAR
jgi:hypothetical protein